MKHAQEQNVKVETIDIKREESSILKCSSPQKGPPDKANELVFFITLWPKSIDKPYKDQKWRASQAGNFCVMKNSLDHS